MTSYRIQQAAALLGVSDDTVRRWIDSERLPVTSGDGPREIAGEALAAHARSLAAERTPAADPLGIGRSARNNFVGLVTQVIADTVMAQVELQCGPHRVVSLMSAEAVRELNLEVGSLAVAVVKATTVIVETAGAA